MTTEFAGKIIYLLIVALALFASWVQYTRDFDRFALRSLKKNDRVYQGFTRVTFIFEFCEKSDAMRFSNMVGGQASQISSTNGGCRCEVTYNMRASALRIKKERLRLAAIAFLNCGEFYGIK